MACRVIDIVSYIFFDTECVPPLQSGQAIPNFPFESKMNLILNSINYPSLYLDKLYVKTYLELLNIPFQISGDQEGAGTNSDTPVSCF